MARKNKDKDHEAPDLPEGVPPVAEADHGPDPFSDDQPPAKDEPRALPGSGKFEVRLKHAPTLIVSAPDRANAWEAYKQKMGIITTEFSPEIMPVE
jgi:hypothetical protein